MAQKVRVSAILADYLDLVPSVQGGVQLPISAVPVNDIFWPVLCTDIHAGKTLITLIHIKSNKQIKLKKLKEKNPI